MVLCMIFYRMKILEFVALNLINYFNSEKTTTIISSVMSDVLQNALKLWLRDFYLNLATEFRRFPHGHPTSNVNQYNYCFLHGIRRMQQIFRHLNQTRHRSRHINFWHFYWVSMTLTLATNFPHVSLTQKRKNLNSQWEWGQQSQWSTSSSLHLMFN